MRLDSFFTKKIMTYDKPMILKIIHLIKTASLSITCGIRLEGKAILLPTDMAISPPERAVNT